MKKQNLKWILNLILYGGFLVAFYLDLTGLSLHQWLGIAVGILCLVHLLQHAPWVKTTLGKFTAMPARTQINFMVDVAISLGMSAIIVSGLVISTWLNLPLVNYDTWRVLHIAFAVETLVALLVKLALHWKMIGLQLKKLFVRQTPHLQTAPPPLPAQAARVPVAVNGSKTVSRRDFLAMMGAFSLVSTLTIAHLIRGDELTVTQAASGESVQPTPTELSTATAQIVEQPTLAVAEAEPTATTIVPTATSQPTLAQAADNTACVIRCRNGCSYPGRCRRYVDANGNGKCDLGECL